MSVADPFYSLVDLLKDKEGSDLCPIVPPPALARSLYAAFRQATDGDCHVPVTDATIEEWATLRGVPAETAMTMYMQTVAQIVSQINEQSLSPAGVAYLHQIKSCLTRFMTIAGNGNQFFDSPSALSDASSPTHQYASTPLSPGLFGALSTNHTHLASTVSLPTQQPSCAHDNASATTPADTHTPAHTPARKRTPSASATSRVRALAMAATGKTPAKTPAKASTEPSVSTSASSHLHVSAAAAAATADGIAASVSIAPVAVNAAVDASFVPRAVCMADAAVVCDEADTSPPATPAPQRTGSGHASTTTATTTATSGDVTPRKQPSTHSHGHTPHKSSRKSALVDRLSGVEAGVRELVAKVVQTPMRGPPARHNVQDVPTAVTEAAVASLGVDMGAGNPSPMSSRVSKHSNAWGDMACDTPATAGLAPLIGYLRERVSPGDECLPSPHSRTHENAAATSRATASGVPASAVNAFCAAEVNASVAYEQSLEALQATSVLARSITSVSDRLTHLLNYVGLGVSSYPDTAAPTLLGALNDMQQRVVAVENAVRTIADAVGLKNVFSLTLKPFNDNSREENEGLEESPRRRVAGEHLRDCCRRDPIPTSFMAKVRWCIRRALSVGGKIALTFVRHMLMFLACLWVYRNYKEHFSTLASLLK